MHAAYVWQCDGVVCGGAISNAAATTHTYAKVPGSIPNQEAAVYSTAETSVKPAVVDEGKGWEM
jgi:hypothetical protein